MAYGSDQEFSDWLAGQGLLLPVGANPTTLRSIGSAYMDAAYEWRLSCSVRTGGFEQENAWPRTGHYVNGQEVPDTLIPTAWVQASYRAAYLEALTPGWATGTTDPNRVVRKEKVDSLEVEYFGSNDGGTTAPVAAGMPADGLINGLVAMWLCSTARNMNSLFRVI